MNRKLHCTCRYKYQEANKVDPTCDLHSFIRQDAIEFAVWCSENVGCHLSVYTPEERERHYNRYLKDTGKKSW